MSKEQPQVDPSVELKQAEQEVGEVLSLAQRTGMVHQTKAEADRYGVRASVANYAHYDDVDESTVSYRSSRRPSIEVEDAAIARVTGDDEFSQAKTKERTGNYSTGSFVDGDVADGVVVTRPDGSGGTYRGRIGGYGKSNTEKATAIIAQRAAKRVGRAVIDRAISIGEELKEKREDNQ